jgi:CheY-like chemotaxis protein
VSAHSIDYGEGTLTIRCLIVDDNANFLEAARGLLEGDGIRVVAAAATGDEALEGAQRHRPDVALVDVLLGEESGLDLARRLVEAPGLEQMPVILISTYSERDFADLVAGCPAAGFLSKSDLSGSAILEILQRDRG